MANKKKSSTFKTEGELEFKSRSLQKCNFHMEDDKLGKLGGFRRMEFTPDILPSDFEYDKYEVTGKYTFEIVITSK